MSEPEALPFDAVVSVDNGRVRRLEGVQQAIDWIANDAPATAHLALQDAMKMLLLARGTGLKADVAAARRALVARF